MQANPSSSLLESRNARSPIRAVCFAALLIVATLLVFGDTLRHDFVYWDDNNGIFENADFNPPKADGLAKFWGNVRDGYRGFYVPVTYTVYWSAAHVARVPVPVGMGIINHTNSLPNPAVFHGLNLTFHLGAVAMAFLVLRRLVKSDGAALFGAAVFALHPLQADPVNWASNMYTPLSGLLAVSALYLHFRFTDARERGATRRAWAIFIAGTTCYAAALLTKPTIILLPIVVLLLETFMRRRTLRQCAFLLIWAALGVADAIITRHTQTFPDVLVPPMWQRPFIATDALAFYISKLFLPIGLACDYSRSPAWSVKHDWIWFTWMLPVAVTYVCWRQRQRLPWLWVAAIVMLLGVVPTIGLTPFDYQVYSTVADRYMYFSMFGAAIASAFVARALWERRRRAVDAAARALGVVAVERRRTNYRWHPAKRLVLPGIGLCMLLGTLSWVQTDYWRNTRTLFTHNLEVNPQSLAAHRQLAFSLLVRDNPADREEAIKHYQIALNLKPDDSAVASNIGILLLRTGRPEEAVSYFLLAIQQHPERGPLYENLGNAMLACGELKAAAQAYAQALTLMPNLAPTQLRQADMLARSAHPEMAVPHYQAVLAVHPDWERAKTGLARVTQQVQKRQNPTQGQGQATIVAPEDRQ